MRVSMFLSNDMCSALGHPLRVAPFGFMPVLHAANHGLLTRKQPARAAPYYPARGVRKYCMPACTDGWPRATRKQETSLMDDRTRRSQAIIDDESDFDFDLDFDV